jgi:hypothetical protein
MRTQSIRPKFIYSAAVGLALAIVLGYPVSGWMMDRDGAEDGGSSAAYSLAKAGVDRALWQINQKKMNLQAIVDGSFVPGLNDDTSYTDLPGGAYKVQARYDKAAKEIRILGTGIEAKTGAKRSLELVLKQQPDEKGLLQSFWREVPSKG